MQNYQGLLNPSNFAQNRMMPTGASHWLQYAQPPQYLNVGQQGGTGTPTTPPGNPGTPGTPTPPTPPVRPPGPAGGGDSGWGAGRPGGMPGGQPAQPPHGFNTAMNGPFPTNVGGYDVNGPMPRGLAQNIFDYYSGMVDHDRFMTEKQGRGANTAYYKNWLPQQYWGMAQRMNMYPEATRKQGWNTLRDQRGDNPLADFLPARR